MEPKLTTVPLSAIIFDKDVYPRREHDPQLVQQYAENMDSIEAQKNFISIAEDMRMVDGRHRHLAYQTLYLEEQDHEIQVFVYPILDTKDIYKLAAELNSDAGWQMTQDDKRRATIRLYRDYQETQEEIARTLKIRKDKVNKWLKAILDSEREEREEKIWSLWLSCHKQQDIADEVGANISQISRFLQETCAQFHGNDLQIFRNFEPKVYTVWNFPSLTNRTKIFGSIPQEIIDNLLYYYTEPFGVVFDPFGGGGSTIDVCIKRKRRYYVSDLSPIPARTDIRPWDITEGLPVGLPVPELVFLDPPYWKQAKGQYGDKETDLGNVPLDKFLDIVGDIAKLVKRKWGDSRPDARLALIIGQCQNDWQFVDLPFLCYERISKHLSLDARIQVPYSTQIHGGDYVNKAKENKKLLYLFRDLMVFKQ